VAAIKGLAQCFSSLMLVGAVEGITVGVSEDGGGEAEGGTEDIPSSFFLKASISESLGPSQSSSSSFAVNTILTRSAIFKSGGLNDRWR